VRPRLERLELRDCPSAVNGPEITNFAVRRLSASSVELTGNITDTGQNGLIVFFSGAGSATTKVSLDAYDNGQFDTVLYSVLNLGTFFAEATDSAGNTSAEVTAFANNGPTLTLSCNQMPNRQVRVYGTVRDVDPANATITFSGIISGTTTSNSSGDYVFTASASALGTISATATNTNNVASNTAQTTLNNTAPIISNFTATAAGITWTMAGQVADEWAMGLTVRVGFPGLTSPLQATVGGDDWFSVSTTVTGSPFGTATAQTTDWWGAVSNQAQYSIR
jgi:hypothetical protein